MAEVTVGVEGDIGGGRRATAGGKQEGTGRPGRLEGATARVPGNYLGKVPDRARANIGNIPSSSQALLGLFNNNMTRCL